MFKNLEPASCFGRVASDADSQAENYVQGLASSNKAMEIPARRFRYVIHLYLYTKIHLYLNLGSGSKSKLKKEPHTSIRMTTLVSLRSILLLHLIFWPDQAIGDEPLNHPSSEPKSSSTSARSVRPLQMCWKTRSGF